MSVQLVAWALQTPCGSVSRKAVLIALADATNGHTGLCCPSLKRLARETDLSVSTVQRAIDALIEMGLVVKQERARDNGSTTSNAYSFVTTPPGHGDHPPLVTVTTPEPEVRTGSEPTTSAAPPQARPKISRERRDEVWDTLTDIFGPVTTRSNETLRGRHVSELADAGASRQEILRRARAWPAHFDSATMTAAALVKHWDTLGRKPLRRR